MIQQIITEMKERIKSLERSMLSFSMTGSQSAVDNCRNRKSELERMLQYVEEIYAEVAGAGDEELAAAEYDGFDSADARVWVEDGRIKCMSQMCEVGGVRCPRYDDCDMVVFDMSEIFGEDE